MGSKTIDSRFILSDNVLKCYDILSKNKDLTLKVEVSLCGDNCLIPIVDNIGRNGNSIESPADLVKDIIHICEQLCSYVRSIS